MIWKKFSHRSHKIALAVLLAGIVAVAALAIASPSQAHCDSAKGPVATAAHQALISDNVQLILPYVKPEAEAELTAAFKEARSVRKMGSTSRQLADRYFIETAIRLHRIGEGAPYYGVSDEETPQAILVADQAMSSGSTQAVYTMLEPVIHQAVEKKYQAVVEARAEAARLNTVEAHRERVEAELMFEKFVYELYTLASSNGPITEGHAH